MKCKRRDWEWLTRDKGEFGSYSARLWSGSKRPQMNEYGWFDAKHDAVSLCLSGLRAHGINITPGQCLKVRIKLEVIE